MPQRPIRAHEGVREQAKTLRRKQTRAEAVLWEKLRAHRLDGLNFRRQHPMGRFIVDFHCAECRLVVELDGPIHEDRSVEDEDRTQIIESHDCRVIRFTNEQVLTAPDEVLQGILSVARTGPKRQ